MLGGRGLLGSRLCSWLFHQVGSSFWRQNWLTGSWEGPGMLPSPWFHRVPPSIPCCTVELGCSSYILNQHSSTTTSTELPCRKKGDSTVLKQKETNKNQKVSFFLNYNMLLEISKKGEEWRQGRVKERGVTQVNVSCHSFRVSWYF